MLCPKMTTHFLTSAVLQPWLCKKSYWECSTTFDSTNWPGEAHYQLLKWTIICVKSFQVTSWQAPRVVESENLINCTNWLPQTDEEQCNVNWILHLHCIGTRNWWSEHMSWELEAGSVTEQLRSNLRECMDTKPTWEQGGVSMCSWSDSSLLT